MGAFGHKPTSVDAAHLAGKRTLECAPARLRIGWGNTSALCDDVSTITRISYGDEVGRIALLGAGFNRNC